ncbi:MAG: hypothetical protein MI725_00870, partial [Pirellulales bacterium]|nr:hypothetical protein [Pirellulales bacterium]
MKTTATRMYLAAMMVVMATTTDAHAGVMVGSSSLIGSLDYSDTWTTTANGGNADRVDGASPGATGLIVENSYGNPSQSWTGSIWSIRTDSSVSGSGYPGTSGSGSNTGLAEVTVNFDDFGIEYGLENEYVVQFDAVQTLDRINITTSAVRDSFVHPSGLSVFFRDKDRPGPEIGLYNVNVGETDTGFSSGINEKFWYNYAVRFDIPNDELEVFVDEVSVGTLDLSTFASGSYANIMTNAAVSVGHSDPGTPATSPRGWSDN